jgi:acid phosphatase type 7
MIILFFVVLLLAASSNVLGLLKTRVGHHSFPLETEKGEQLANEFQLIQPHNIQDARFKKLNSGATYSFSIDEPFVIQNDDVVTVHFATSKPSPTDWIAAYSPADVDYTKTVPVKYTWADDNVNYVATGKGSAKFNLTNLRADVGFVFFTNGTTYPVLVAKAEQTISFKNTNEPLRPRIVATGDYDIFSLLWNSENSREPTLLWGLRSGEYTEKVSANTDVIRQEEVCGSPANTIGWRSLGNIHSANLTGMRAVANQRIYYIFGDAATNDYSTEYSFLAPPLPGTQPPSRPTTAILFDDLGRGSRDDSYTWNEYGRPSVQTIESVGARVRRGEVDVVYHGGDISYATGYLAVWDFYLDMLSPVSSGAIYLTTVGNHESDWTNSASYYNVTDSGGECGVLATRLLPMPAPATTNAPWWSYEVGLIHFIGLSSEHDYTTGSAQYNWLLNDLRNVDRSRTPWIVFGAHRAMYLNSNYGGPPTSDLSAMDNMIEHLEPLLYRYRVNFAFYGHNHVVQRHAAVLNRTVIQHAVPITDSLTGETIYLQDDPQATVHFVIGTAGAAFTPNAVTPYPDWNELVFYEWGYAKLTAVNATHLDYQWILNSNDRVLDHVLITQSDPTQPWKKI